MTYSSETVLMFVLSRIGPTFLGAYLLVWKKTRPAVVLQIMLVTSVNQEILKCPPLDTYCW